MLILSSGSQDQLRRTFNGLVPLVGSPVGWYPIRSDACIKIFTQEKTFDEAEVLQTHTDKPGDALMSVKITFLWISATLRQYGKSSAVHSSY